MKKLLLVLAILPAAACGSSQKACTSLAPACNAGSPLQSVSVSSPATSLAVSLTMQFTATGHYQNGSTLDVTDGVSWSTDSPEVALIGITGIAIGENAGTVNVTATAGSISGSEAVTVNQ